MENATVKLSNTIYGTTIKALNAQQPIKRENILSSFSPEIITNSWEVLCKFIAQNYQSGKGTYIPQFGNFTYSSVDVNLEGTTNQFARDHKARKPVFIVSRDFVEHLKPGQYTPSSGIIYYNQKQSNTVSHVKVNYAEMSYALNISKNDYTTIINNLILHIADTIRRGEFKNKEMPALGVLLLRGNVLAVKFNEELVNEVKHLPQKLFTTKKNIHLCMETNQVKDGDNALGLTNLPNVAKTLQKLRPKTAIVTKLTEDGEKWLKENMDISLDEIQEEQKKISNVNFAEERLKETCLNNEVLSSAYVNDVKPPQIRTLKKLTDLNISNAILEAIYYNKGVLVSEMKALDKKLCGNVKKFEFVRGFINANIHKQLNSNNVTDIVNLYSSTETVDYLKVIALLVKEIQKVIEHSDEMIKNENNNTNERSLSKNVRATSATPLSQRNVNIASMLSTIFSKKVEIDEVKNEIKAIKLIFPTILSKNATRLDQNISLEELANILRELSIVYPKEKMAKILKFLEIQQSDAFTLSQFQLHLNSCKILSSEMTSDEIISACNKLKDIVYTLGGRNFVFSKGPIVSIETFVELFKNKTHFTEDILRSIFNYIVKTDRDFTKQDYIFHFEQVKNNELDEEFESKAVSIIHKNISNRQLKIDEYFDQLLSYNVNRKANVITQVDWHRAFAIEKYPFTAEEVNYLFFFFDKKKDGMIDRQEFISVMVKPHKPLSVIKDIIKKNHLDIEDLMFRLQMDLNKNEVLEFIPFKVKMKLFDYTLSHEFILGLFEELCAGKDFVDTKTIIREFTVYKKEHFRNTNNESFKLNFIEHIKSVSDFTTMKSGFEKIDSYNNGLLTKVDFCSVIQQFTCEYQDEDIMKFIRISTLFSPDNKVKYPEFLNLIFYNSGEDKFFQCLEHIKKFLLNECNRDLSQFFAKMNIKETPKQKFFTVDKMYQFLSNIIDNLNKKTVCKFDLDSDGKISFDDLKGIIDRYISTSFFKFENSDSRPEINLYANDMLSEEKFKQIVKDIKCAMKAKNLTEIGLFRKFDTNKDGFVSHPEFSKNIGDIVTLSPAIKDQFFNYLDVYHLGMVDLETFLKRFKEFKSNEIIVKNSNFTENRIIEEFSIWIAKAASLSDTEIFSMIDFDSDGIISIKDFTQFILSQLAFSKFELNEFRIDRVMQQISLTKNKNIGLPDLKEFINKCKSNQFDNYFIDLKETFTHTVACQNLNPKKENSEWINEAIERLGMYISEIYGNIDNFFADNVKMNSTKMNIDDFKRFNEKHYDCFEGFNLTNDEILALYTSLDSHKKDFLSMEDFKNKLTIFDFFKKMHDDIRNFLKENFHTSVDAFKYFKKSEQLSNDTNAILSKKEFFDGICLMFPKKYSTNTILKYMGDKFQHIETISFEKFNYVYFESFKKNDVFIQKRLKSSRTNYFQKDNAIPTSKGNSTTRAQSAKPFSRRTFEPSRHPGLETPFDSDALQKIKRLIHSSRFDYSNFFKMHELISDKGYVNQFEFRNILKKLNIGLTHLEIEEIITKSGKTRDGRINIPEFVRFLSAEDAIIAQSKKNIALILGDIKQLIYKYYSNPTLAFQLNDKTIMKQIDFDKFKQMISSLYDRDSKPVPNFTMLKNSFEYIDLRKDGIIDFQEWLKAFSVTESSLDIINQNINSNQLNVLRIWENSKEIPNIYKLISKNRKIIKENSKPFLMSQETLNIIQSDNLISILKGIFPTMKMSNTQWKMLIGIADREKNNFIDFDLFLRLVDNSAKQSISHPKYKN